jgi:hypothetical protein
MNPHALNFTDAKQTNFRYRQETMDMLLQEIFGIVFDPDPCAFRNPSPEIEPAEQIAIGKRV